MVYVKWKAYTSRFTLISVLFHLNAMSRLVHNLWLYNTEMMTIEKQTSMQQYRTLPINLSKRSNPMNWKKNTRSSDHSFLRGEPPCEAEGDS